MIRYVAKVPETVTRRVGTQAKRILKKGIGTPTEKLSLSSSRLLDDVIIDAAEQERRAAQLLEMRAGGFSIPAGTRHLPASYHDASAQPLRDAVGALPPVQAGKTRLFRGASSEGPDHWYDLPGQTHVAELHNTSKGGWYSNDPGLATAYGSKGQSTLQHRRGLAGLNRGKTNEELHALRKEAREMDPWGTLMYADVDEGLAASRRRVDNEWAFGGGEVTPTPLYGTLAQAPAADETAARVMRNVAESKRARAARFETTARPAYRDPAISQKRAAKLMMKSSPSSGRMGGVPTRSKTTSQVSKLW